MQKWAFLLVDQLCQCLQCEYTRKKEGKKVRWRGITCNGSKLAVDLKKLSKNDPSTDKMRNNGKSKIH